MKPKLTFDTNCLVDLENSRCQYSALKKLLSLNGSLVEIYIPAICASENQKHESLFKNFNEFKEFLKRIGCKACQTLPAMCYIGISFIGHCLITGNEMINRERKIHDVLFPNYPFDYSGYCKKTHIYHEKEKIDPKWRRIKCDVQAMWCHVHYKNDIFVTRDNNFHRATKKAKLLELGAKQILTPEECFKGLNIWEIKGGRS